MDIIDQNQNVVKFKFEENICAFCAGYFSIEPNNPSPAFVYITLNHEIVLHYNVKLKALQTTTLISLMKDHIKDFYSLKENQYSLEWTRPEQASLYHSCLYYDDSSGVITAYKNLLQQRLSSVRSLSLSYSQANQVECKT